MRITGSVSAKTSSLAYYIWGGVWNICGSVHDSIIKQPPFLKQLYKPGYLMLLVIREISGGRHIFLFLEKLTLNQQCFKIRNILEHEKSNFFRASSSIFLLSTRCTPAAPVTNSPSPHHTCPRAHAVPTACDSMFPQFLTPLVTVQLIPQNLVQA